MKRISLLILAQVMVVLCFSETYPVKFGPSEKGARYSAISLLGKAGNNTMVFRSNIGNSKLVKFDPSLSKELETKIDFKLDNKTRSFEGMSLFRDKVILFTSYKDKKTKMKKLYYDVFSASTLSLISKGKEIVSYNANSKMFRSSGGFDIFYSEDESMMGVIVYVPYEKKGKQKFQAVVFDDQFNEVSKESYELPVLDSKMALGRAHLSNSGEFFIAAAEYLGEKKIFKPSKIKRHIYQLDEGGLIDHVIKLKNKHIYSYTFKTNEYNDLILAGFYAEESKRGVAGTFYLRFDSKENEVDSENSQAFSDDFITQGWSDRAKKKASKKKKEPVLYKYSLRELVATDDGGALLVAEQYYSVTRTYRTSNGGTRTVTYYYYNDVIVSKMDDQGEFQWNKKVRKYQVSTNDGGYYSSFAFHSDKDNIYIMYNDNMKNYDESGKAKPVDAKIVPTSFASNKKNVTSIVTIDINTGELKKEQLFNKKETGTIAVPKIHFSSKDEDKLFFYTKKGKKERLGQISFK